MSLGNGGFPMAWGSNSIVLARRICGRKLVSQIEIHLGLRTLYTLATKDCLENPRANRYSKELSSFPRDNHPTPGDFPTERLPILL